MLLDIQILEYVMSANPSAQEYMSLCAGAEVEENFRVG